MVLTLIIEQATRARIPRVRAQRRAAAQTSDCPESLGSLSRQFAMSMTAESLAAQKLSGASEPAKVVVGLAGACTGLHRPVVQTRGRSCRDANASATTSASSGYRRRATATVV